MPVMAAFIVRFFFDNDDFTDAIIEAETQEAAERQVAAEAGANAGMLFVDTHDGRYLVSRNALRCCQVLPADGPRPQPLSLTFAPCA